MKRIVVGMTGASGVIYGIRLLDTLRSHGAEPHLVISGAARKNILIETAFTVEQVEKMAHRVYDPDDLAAPISSGSFRTGGMVIAPCTVKTLSGVANSYTENLIVRTADVTLKEKRKLVLVVRETPLHRGHLELMVKAAGLGAVILPPMPAFYHRPKSLDDIIDHTVGKILDMLDIEHDLFRRWGTETD
ncbi:MAG: UbiX family flavin prenyltransferase [Syntrophorhabdaceae bacterium]|nr:UbiX family flavin prenyltransferase [Syntrophorhabdaceae bacterium]MDD4196720.1 UbiX family flavin prenyltransferase [Syntrophorhabdaceae bacterium]HOD75021.1 UbiX family flavin prenyltransferase [Syntrophorhabdaceae bacterium]